ncbi:MAG: tetratricopeptide repeat protein [Rhodobacteraceae bacterium]|nr:tetratricopeptide repeat protein [Paracoccaceae bacterium]
MIAGLKAYPEDAVDETFAAERITIVGNAATALLDLRQFDEAQTGYRSALAAIDKLTDSDGDQAWTWRAVAHHQLGMVAQERRDFDAAEDAYKTALEIYVRFGDGHHAAIVIGNIARLAAADPDRQDRLITMVADCTGATAEDVADLFSKTQSADKD